MAALVVTFSFDNETNERLIELAAKKGVGKSEFVRDLINHAYDQAQGVSVETVKEPEAA